MSEHYLTNEDVNIQYTNQSSPGAVSAQALSPQNPILENSQSVYSSDFLSEKDISQICRLFGSDLSGSQVDQINLIRNRLNFRGIVDRKFFNDAEILAILDAFSISRTLPLLDQQKSLQGKIYETQINPDQPYIPHSNPTASPIIAQLHASNSFPPLSGPHGVFVSMHTPETVRVTPEKNFSEEFSFEEIQKIAQHLGLSTYGNRSNLINNIRAYLNHR